MKKLILTLAFTLAFATSYANEKNDSNYAEISTIELNQLLDSNFSVRKIMVLNEDFSCTILHAVYRRDGSLMGTFEITAPDDHQDCGGVVAHKMR